MKTTKTPAPRRAGTAAAIRTKTRLAQELEVAEGIEELRYLNPAGYARCTRLLSDLVAEIGGCTKT